MLTTTYPLALNFKSLMDLVVNKKYPFPLSALPEHPQKTYANGLHVDAGIADLLKILWNKGIRTEYSCQGDEGTSRFDYAYILFSREEDAKFLFFMLETEFNEEVYYNPRQTQYGGGASVHFNSNLIKELEKYYAEEYK